MARIARLKKENGYWVAWVRGKKRSFGNCRKVAPLDAQRAFIAALDGKQGKKSDANVEITEVDAAAARTVAQLVAIIWSGSQTIRQNATPATSDQSSSIFKPSTCPGSGKRCAVCGPPI